MARIKYEIVKSIDDATSYSSLTDAGVIAAKLFFAEGDDDIHDFLPIKIHGRFYIRVLDFGSATLFGYVKRL